MGVTAPYIISLAEISDDDWQFIWSAVEAGWTSPRIHRDCPALSFWQVMRAVRYVRDELGIDGRRRA